jgi:hypothetical protein
MASRRPLESKLKVRSLPSQPELAGDGGSALVLGLPRVVRLPRSRPPRTYPFSTCLRTFTRVVPRRVPLANTLLGRFTRRGTTYQQIVLKYVLTP